jgi:rSAM/selenodomain-associated transferase 2
MKKQSQLSIIIPALNESFSLPLLLRNLQPMRTRGHEVILVDGNSEDGTVVLARPFVDQVIQAPRGRASQMAAGAGCAKGDILWFLHADVIPPADADQLVLQALDSKQHDWGRFDVRLTGKHPMLYMIGKMMNLRSCVTGVATGDQGIFVRRRVLQEIGGVPLVPLMEDIKLSKLLRRRCKYICIKENIIASGRRWEKHGVFRTICLMWKLRFLYVMGVNPTTLARMYK